jgi:mono/diheme cytochrome c family protein
MAIPLPFRDAATMKRLDPFIARGWRLQPGAPIILGKFPAIPKEDVPDDRRPIEFSGNKLVVAERFHPEVAPAAQPGFSPWRHADTLLGIELVAATAYYAQFEVGGDATVQRGLTLFRQNCQFCHGVRDVGARFGWDFVDSEAVQNHQLSAANLYHNVAYKPRNAAELGLMMPALGFLTEADAGAMRAWMQAIANVPMTRYLTPPARR